MKKKLPECKNEDDERKFWATADSTEYVDWQAGKRKKLVQLKPSLRTISLRLPVSMIEDLKVKNVELATRDAQLGKLAAQQRTSEQLAPRSLITIG